MYMCMRAHEYRNLELGIPLTIDKLCKHMYVLSKLSLLWYHVHVCTCSCAEFSLCVCVK